MFRGSPCPLHISKTTTVLKFRFTSILLTNSQLPSRGVYENCVDTPQRYLDTKGLFKTKRESWGARNQWWHVFQQMTVLSSYVQVAWAVFAKMWKNHIESLSWLSVLSSHLSAKTLMAPSPLSSHFLGCPLPGSAVVTEGHFSLVKQNQRLIWMNWL